MTIQQIYKLAINLGIKADFRSKQEIDKKLKKEKEKFEKLDTWEKKVFDRERITNPYSDTRILMGDPKKKIKKILAGIDIDTREIILAKMLGDIDLVISHHPQGIAYAGLDDVMHLQADILSQYGVPIHFAENLLRARVLEVSRSLHPVNHERPIDAAKLLDVAFMCTHTPTDNLVASFIRKKLKSARIEYVGELIKLLREVPEYTQAIKNGAGPRLFAGSEENRLGKIAVTGFTGGAEGSPKLYAKLSTAGISTVVEMHASEKHRKAAEKAQLNVVIAGHMSSDSIGMNLFLDELLRKGVKVVSTSGLIRIDRSKKRKS